VRLLVWWENRTGGSRILVSTVLGFFILLLVIFVGYGVLSYFRWNSRGMAIPWIGGLEGSGEQLEEVPQISSTGAKTEPSPINGVLYTKEQAEVFMNRRPLAIMINNHVDARPQFGLSKADLIYEAVAEGGITRFLALFHSRDVNKVGPVRSARIYYEDWAAEFNAWYAHWGGAYMTVEDKTHKDDPSYDFTCNPAADAYAKINRINLPSLDQMWLGGTAYWRDNSRGVAREHTGFTSTMKLWKEAPNRYPGWEGFVDFDHWKFKEDQPAQAPNPATGTGSGQASLASQVSFTFWGTPGYDVRWEYDPASNSYKRYQGGKLQVDAGAGNTPIMAKDVILQFTPESSFNDRKHHLNYQTVGTGDAKIFLDGKVLDATWKKKDIRSRTKFYDRRGNEVKFNRGQIWIEVVPARNADSVKIS